MSTCLRCSMARGHPHAKCRGVVRPGNWQHEPLVPCSCLVCRPAPADAAHVMTIDRRNGDDHDRP